MGFYGFIKVYFVRSCTILGAIREILGNGSVFGWKIAEGIARIIHPETTFTQGSGMLIFILAPGAFIVLGYIIAIINKINKANA